jgi:hypothetical protein
VTGNVFRGFHSDGPWLALADETQSPPHINITSFQPERRIVFSLPGKRKTDPDVMLITAAPEMLACLNKLMNDDAWFTIPEPLRREIVEAVTKAEGF